MFFGESQVSSRDSYILRVTQKNGKYTTNAVHRNRISSFCKFTTEIPPTKIPLEIVANVSYFLHQSFRQFIQKVLHGLHKELRKEYRPNKHLRKSLYKQLFLILIKPENCLRILEYYKRVLQEVFQWCPQKSTTLLINYNLHFCL